MAAAIASSQLELIVMGVAAALILALAGVRALRRRRYRARRTAGEGLYNRDGALAPPNRLATGRQPVAPSFSSAPERVKRS